MFVFQCTFLRSNCLFSISAVFHLSSELIRNWKWVRSSMNLPWVYVMLLLWYLLSVLWHCWLGVRFASFKSRLVLPFWYRLTQVVLEKRPFDGCSGSSYCGICHHRQYSMFDTVGWETERSFHSVNTAPVICRVSRGAGPNPVSLVYVYLWEFF